jgi:hypothetical protein
MFPCLKTVRIEACSPYQNNASTAKPATKPVQFCTQSAFLPFHVSDRFFLAAIA